VPAAVAPASMARLERVLAEMGEVRRAFAGAGLTVRQYRALRALEGGALRLGQLAERVEIRAPSCVSLVDSLAAAELVDRRPDPRDGRGSLVGLTTTGRRRLREASRRAAEALDRPPRRRPPRR
jgi:DNA-binding MarR family transcriptional regulator